MPPQLAQSLTAQVLVQLMVLQHRTPLTVMTQRTAKRGAQVGCWLQGLPVPRRSLMAHCCKGVGTPTKITRNPYVHPTYNCTRTCTCKAASARNLANLHFATC